MELRRAGEALLRSQSSFLLPFLTPSIRQHTPSRITQLRTSSPTPVVVQSRRPFTSSSTHHQQAAAAAAPEPPNEHGNDPPSANNPPPRPTTSRSPPDDENFSRLLDDALDLSRPTTGQARTTRYKTPGAQSYNRPGGGASFSPSSSADDVRSHFDRTFNLSRQRQGSIDLNEMLMPHPGNKAAQGLADPPPAENAAERTPTLRLGPSTGRSVVVDASRGVDLGRGFRTLDILVARNRVRADFNRQRFHERPGLKRKRLGRERWRKRFKAGFQAVVRRVEEMRRKGW